MQQSYNQANLDRNFSNEFATIVTILWIFTKKWHEKYQLSNSSNFARKYLRTQKLKVLFLVCFYPSDMVFKISIDCVIMTVLILISLFKFLEKARNDAVLAKFTVSIAERRAISYFYANLRNHLLEKWDSEWQYSDWRWIGGFSV